MDGDERNLSKFRAIIETESVLAPLRYVFNLLLTGKYKRTNDPELVQKVQDVNNRVGSRATDNIKGYFLRASVHAKFRISQLIDVVAHQSEPQSFVSALLHYHNLIVKERRNIPWIREEEGQYKILSGMRINEKEVTQIYSWYHSYYLDSLRNIVSGLGEKTIKNG